jgi:NADH dehydrogenase
LNGVTSKSHRVLIAGGGFGGLYAARALAKAPVEVTLIDRQNYHLFQPLLYQVAIGGLAPADIAAPLRWVLRQQPNARVILGEIEGVDLPGRRLQVEGAWYPYDTLIVATGATHHYFGNDSWGEHAPGLKTLRDATEMRRRILTAFEHAELSRDPNERQRLLTFTIVGGGPTGVELAGAVAELARDTLRHDFRDIDTSETRVLLVEGQPRLLSTFPESLSAHALEALDQLGVEVWLGAQVVALEASSVTLQRGSERTTIPCATHLWAAGVRGSEFGRRLAEAAGIATDRSGRLPVQPDFSLPGHPEVRVIGDLCRYELPASGESPGSTAASPTPPPAGASSAPSPAPAAARAPAPPGPSLMPGVAPAAMQAGQFVARDLLAILTGRRRPTFRYRDKGQLATIGRKEAVAQLGRARFGGLFAWWLWLLVHLMYLVGFANRLIVLFKWAVAYLTFNRGSRLILPRSAQEPRSR